nr:CsgE family curli-type amyloid fiber assembly protein [uncultured Flavobacterium sp.]
MKNHVLAIVFFLLGNCYAKAQNADDLTIKPKIELKVIENLLMIEPTLENLEGYNKSFFYKLSVFKTNLLNKNTSNNTQDGRVILNGNQKINLSKVQVNFNDTDEIVVLLLIYDENEKLVGKDRAVFKKKIADNQPPSNQPDGILPIAIVSNDTKTKFGAEFYEFFFNAYNNLKIRTVKIVKIQEELSFGRTSRIIVSVDDNSISEFITQPDEDFLKEMAGYVADEVLTYFKNLAKQEKFITQY